MPGETTCAIKYVYVEMILNKNVKYDVVAGLFKGFVEKDGEKFVLLHGLKEATNVLNLKFYNMMTIEILEDDYKNMTYLTSEKGDQKIALDMLEMTNKTLLSNNFSVVNDEKIIDIEKYTDIPEDYLKEKKVDKTTGVPGTCSGIGVLAKNTQTYSNTGAVYSKTVVNKDPEPTLFKRLKSKRPTKTALSLLQEKIDRIKAGDFKPDLPETLGEDDDGIEDDNQYGSNYYYGSI